MGNLKIGKASPVPQNQRDLRLQSYCNNIIIITEQVVGVMLLYLQNIGNLNPHHVCVVGSVSHLITSKRKPRQREKCVAGSYPGSQAPWPMKNKDDREGNSKALKALPGKDAEPREAISGIRDGIPC